MNFNEFREHVASKKLTPEQEESIRKKNQEEKDKKWLTVDDFNRSLNGNNPYHNPLDDEDDYDEFDDGEDDDYDAEYDEEYEYRVHGKSSFFENTDQSWNSPLKDEITKEDIDIVFEDNFGPEDPPLKEEDYEKIISGYKKGLGSFKHNRLSLEDAISDLIEEIS